MMRQQLLIFTNTFPYGSGEPFFEGELNALAREFDRILLQPLQGSGEIRTLPSNVDLLKPLKSKARSWEFVVSNLSAGDAMSSIGEFARRYHGGNPVATASVIAKHAALKSALERSPGVKAAITDPAQFVAYSYWGAECALAIPLLRRNGVRTAVRYHSYDLYADRPDLVARRPFIPWQAEIAGAAMLSLFVSEAGLAYFQTRFPEAATECVTSRLGTQPTGERPPRGAEAPLTMVSCAFVSPVKQLHLIAELAERLSADGAVVWRHFGGTQGGADPRYFTPRHPNLVIDYRGNTPNSEVLAHYSSEHVDFVINLSLFEGIPVSLMEAISYGIPVVATDVGANSEVSVPGRSGMLLTLDEAKNADRTAIRIRNALKPGGELDDLAPRQLWKERFDATRNYRQVAKLLATL